MMSLSAPLWSASSSLFALPNELLRQPQASLELWAKSNGELRAALLSVLLLL